MVRKEIISFGSLAILIDVSHLAAIKYSLYWIFPWFDIPMHFLGGVIVAFFIYLMLQWKLPNIVRSGNSHFLRYLLFGALFVGLLWEALELKTGLTFVSQSDYIVDTISDLIIDLMGASFFYFVIQLKSRAKIAE
jgi:hypothetical protein